MAIIKIEVVRNSDGKIVYGNEGDKSYWEKKFLNDASRFDSKTHTITVTDVTAEESSKKQDKIDRMNRIKSVDLTSANTVTALKTIISDLLEEIKELRGL